MKNMTYHANTERLARLEYIVDTIGFGEVVAEFKGKDNLDRPFTQKLTDTGVMIVVGIDGKSIVTAYIANYAQANYCYRQAHGNRRMPQNLCRRINNNEEIRKSQPCFAERV